MEFSWSDFNDLIQDNPLLTLAVEGIKALGSEWLSAIYQKGQMRTLDEEAVLCLEYSLETFSKNYALEYNDTTKIKLIEEVRKKKSRSETLRLLRSVA